MRRSQGLRWIAVLTLLLPATALGQEPPAKPKLDLDGDELPAGAISRCGTIRYRHGGPIFCASYSPDGKSLASIGQDGVRLFNATDGKLVYAWPALDMVEGQVAFSTDGKVLFASDLFTLRELDAISGKEIRTLIDHSNTVNGFALLPDGKTIAVACDDHVLILEANNGRTIRRLIGHKGDVLAVACAPDGLTIASGGKDKTLRLWDLQSGRQRKKVDRWKPVTSLVYTPDGAHLALTAQSEGLEGEAVLVDPVSGQEIRTLRAANTTRGYRVAFSPDGKIMALGDDEQKIRLMDTSDGFVRHVISARVKSVCFSPDCKSIASVGRESMLSLWDTATAECRNPDRGHAAEIPDVVLSTDGRTLVTCSKDDTIRFWDTATGAKSRKTMEGWQRTCRIQLLNGDTLAVIGRSITVVELKSGNYSRSPFSRRTLDHGAFSTNGKFAAACGLAGNDISLFQTSPVKRLFQLPEKENALSDVTAIAVSPDGKTVATAAWDFSGPGISSVVNLWDVGAGKNQTLAQAEIVRAIEFTSNGRELVSAGHDGRIRFTSPVTGQTISEWTVPNEEPIVALAISADGRTIAAGADNGTVRTWERLTGQIRRTLSGHLGEVNALRFSADGRLLVSGSADSTALVWHMSSDESEKIATVHALDAVWSDLQSSDAGLAERAIWRLASADAATIVAFQSELPRVPAADGERIKSLIADLNNDKFAVRKQAETDLAKLGAIAGPGLQSALDSKLSSEQRDRIKALLARLDAIPTGESLGALRAVEALEHNASADARRVLAILAAGSAGPRVAASAKESLERMGANSNQ